MGMIGLGHLPDSNESSFFGRRPQDEHAVIERERRFGIFMTYTHHGFDECYQGRRQYRRELHRAALDPFSIVDALPSQAAEIVDGNVVVTLGDQ